MEDKELKISKATIIVIIIILTVPSYCVYQDNQKETALLEIASEITNICNKEGSCPMQMDGWFEISECKFRDPNTHFTYLLDEEQCDSSQPIKFDLFYSFGPEWFTVARGGVGIEVYITEYYGE